MVNKASDNMEKVGIKNVELRCGYSDNLPFCDDFFDVVASIISLRIRRRL
jgi:ubiquinone/menaquinone biosynthesis C-methylase UbiE